MTPRVFWAVTAVSADVPYTPSAAKVFRSAWIPAPPPESEPAIVNALFIATLLSLEIQSLFPIQEDLCTPFVDPEKTTPAKLVLVETGSRDLPGAITSVLDSYFKETFE